MISALFQLDNNGLSVSYGDATGFLLRSKTRAPQVNLPSRNQFTRGAVNVETDGYKLEKLASESSAEDVNRASVRRFRHRRNNLVLGSAPVSGVTRSISGGGPVGWGEDS